jgi:hypothetical protein
MNYEKNYVTNPYGIGPGATKYNSMEQYGAILGNNAIKIYLNMDEYYKLAEDIIKQETHKGLDESLKQRTPALSDDIKEKVTKALVDKMDKDLLGGLMPSGMKTFLVSEFKGRLGFPNIINIKFFHYLYLKRMIHLIVTSDAYMVE